MTKLIVCLPLCLVLQDQRPLTSGSGTREDSGPPPMAPAAKRQLAIARSVAALAVPSAAAFPATLAWTPLPGLCEHLVPRPQRFSGDLVAGLGVLAAPTPLASLPLRQAFLNDGPGILEDLAYAQPVRFLQMCMAHYEREVNGYHCMLYKRERIKGKLNDLEVCECDFREQPFSIRMEWRKGEGQAKRVLYVAGENKDLLLARPALSRFLPVVTRDPEGTDAKNAGRYTVKQFGIGLGTQRTIAAMLKAKARDKLFVQYYGIESVPQLDGRLCYKFIRKPYVPPEEEGVNELIIYVDVETWLQTGSELRDASGNLIAEYFFRDVQLNPTFDPKQFTREKL
jgi:hypothetical protein